jgi:hypothetical protein
MPSRPWWRSWRWWGVAALASLLAWVVAGPWVLTREIRMEVRCTQSVSDVCLEWRKHGRLALHGVWIDDDKVGPATLEIRPSGTPTRAGTTFEFWLYSAKDDDGREIDLKDLLIVNDPESVRGEWIPFKEGPGIVYVGQRPGLLRLPIGTRGVTLEHATTDMGGRVEFRFRGQALGVDTFAQSMKVETLTLPSAAIASESVTIAQRLPAYRLGEVELGWKGAAGAVATLVTPRVVFSVLGREIDSREVRATALANAEPEGIEPGASWTITGDPSRLRLDAAYSPGLVLHGLGVASTFGALLAAWVVIVMGRAAFAWARRAPVRVLVLLAGVVIAVHVLVAAALPVYVTSDGTDYIDGAAGIAYEPHSLDRIPIYKAPGLMFVLAACMRLGSDFLRVFAGAQVVFGVATACLVYLMLRKRVRWAWATAAACAVGLHPVLLTYQQYLLREVLGAMMFTAVAALLLALGRVADAPRRKTWVLAVTIGVVCGLGAYVRENFQILFLIVPIAVAVIVRWPLGKRGMLAAVTLASAALVLTPYLAVKCWPSGVVGVVSGKTHMNRLLNVWTNDVTDGNDTAYLTHEEWIALDQRARSIGTSDFDYLETIKAGSSSRNEVAAAFAKNHRNTGLVEPLLKKVADEAMLRNPGAQALSIGRSFLNQLGLWNFYSPPDANAGAWYARPLRGNLDDFDTNYHIGTEWMKSSPLYALHKDQLQELVKRTTKDQRSLKVSPWHHFFNEWFWFVHFVRPVVAVLFLVGVWRAIRNGDRALAAIGFMTLFMMAAAAIVVAPATDRFAVPFIPVMFVVAIHTLATWKRSASSPATA